MNLSEYTKLVKESGFYVVSHEANKKVGDPQKNDYSARPVRGWNDATSTMCEEYAAKTFKEDCNAFAVTGRPFMNKGYLMVIDFDVNGISHSNISDISFHDYLFDKEPDTYIQKTPSGGMHYFFYSKKQIPSASIYWNGKEFSKSTRGTTVKTGVDIQGINKQIMLSPSKVVINGELKSYTNNGKTVAALPDDIEERILDIIDNDRINARKMISNTVEREFFDIAKDMDEIIPYLIKAAEAGEFDDRQTWVNLAFALQDDGRDFDLFLKLSWKEDDPRWGRLDKKIQCRSVFDSAKQKGDVTKKTLYYWAKQYGWEPTKKIDPNRGQKDKIFITNYYYKERSLSDNNGNIETKIEFEYKKTFYDDEYFMKPTMYFKTFVATNGKMYLTENTNPDNFITTTQTFFNLCAKYALHIDFRNSGPLTETKYLDFIKTACPKYTRLTTLFEQEQDNETILILNGKYEPKKTGMFREFLNLFTDSTIVDNYRRAAGILSGFLPRKYDAKKPLMALTSSDPGGGKTQSVQLIQDIIEGCYGNGICVGVNENLAEQISGAFGYATKNVIIDDIQPEHVRGDGVFKILTQSVTSQTISAWIMGESHAKVINNKTFWATFSYKVRFKEDVLLRLCRINMKSRYEISDSERLNIEQQKEYFLSNREELMQDIAYYLSKIDVENTNSYIPHSRFGMWSQVMNNLLKEVYPEINNFNFGINEEDEALSEDRTDLRDFLEVLWPARDVSKNGFVSNEVVYQIALKYFGSMSAICKNRQTVPNFLRNSKNILAGEFDIVSTRTPIKYQNKTQRGFYINSKVGHTDYPFTKAQYSLYIQQLVDNQKCELVHHDFEERKVYIEDVLESEVDEFTRVLMRDM